MATLTETAYKVRTGLKTGLLVSLLVSVAWYAGGAAVNYYKATHPPEEPPPTVDFGRLERITFPKETGRPEIELELPTGKMPVFPDRMRVFFAPTKRSNFLDPQRAIETATALGFLFKPEQPSETRYIWRKQDSLNSILEMDIVSGHFVLNRAWQNNPALLAVNTFTSDKQAVADMTSFLQRSGSMPEDTVDNNKVSYLKVQGAKLVKALSLSDADFLQVDLFRDEYRVYDPEDKTKSKILEAYKFYRPNPDKGLVRGVLTGSREYEEKVISLEYGYSKVDYTKSGTYPIKTGQEAYDELKNGGGYVTEKSPKKGILKVRRVQLGYYDDDANHSYALPIYVFLGDQDFVAYVSAVKDEVLVAQ